MGPSGSPTQHGAVHTGGNRSWHKRAIDHFGPDQVDLDWRNPAVLVEFVAQIDRLLAHGAHWIRLDAVGFLWKEPGPPAFICRAPTPS